MAPEITVTHAQTEIRHLTAQLQDCQSQAQAQSVTEEVRLAKEQADAWRQAEQAQVAHALQLKEGIEAATELYAEAAQATAISRKQCTDFMQHMHLEEASVKDLTARLKQLTLTSRPARPTDKTS